MARLPQGVVSPVWGFTSVAADTLGTAFILPVVTALITDFLVRLQVDRALLPKLPPTLLRATRFSERNVLQRGAFLGLAAMGMAAAPVIAGVALLGPPELTTSGFILFKATFAAALGAFVTPVLAWWSLQDASRSSRAAR